MAKSFPVKNDPVFPSENQLLKESTDFSSTTNYNRNKSAASVLPDTVLSSCEARPTAGKILIVKNAFVSSDGPAAFGNNNQVTLLNPKTTYSSTGNNFGTIFSPFNAAFGVNGGSQTVSMNRPIYEGGVYQLLNTQPFFGVNGVLTFGSIVPGSGYTNGTYTNVPLTGGNGVGATANVTVASGAVTTVTLQNSGSGYRVSDSLSAATAIIGSGTGFSIPVATIGFGKYPPSSQIMGIEGYQITADTNFTAKYKILIAGESVMWQLMGNDNQTPVRPYLGENLIGFRMIKYLRSLGKSVRHINKSFGGCNSNDMLYAIKSGWYDVGQDVIIVESGINDALQFGNAGIANFTSNMYEFINYRDQIWRNSTTKIPIIFCAPGQVQGLETGTLLPAYRTALQSVANDATIGGQLNNVFFCDFSTQLVLGPTQATDLNYYDVERTVGNRTHPSGLGHALQWAALKPIFDLQFFQNYFK